MVACEQWAFQVSQGSVETLFRCCGKLLHHFEANLFRKRRTKFHWNRPSFTGVITKKRFGLFFKDHHQRQFTAHRGFVSSTQLATRQQHRVERSAGIGHQFQFPSSNFHCYFYFRTTPRPFPFPQEKMRIENSYSPCKPLKYSQRWWWFPDESALTCYLFVYTAPKHWTFL